MALPRKIFECLENDNDIDSNILRVYEGKKGSLVLLIQNTNGNYDFTIQKKDLVNFNKSVKQSINRDKVITLGRKDKK